MSVLTSELAENIGSVASADFPRVIRRDLPQSNLRKPRVVPWLGHKIEKAVDAACSSVDHAATGQQVRTEVEIRIRREHPLFVHIEEVQDLVENTLIELGHGQVALAYGKYRARRAAFRCRLRRESVATQSCSMRKIYWMLTPTADSWPVAFS